MKLRLEKLPREFYLRPTLQVAKDLIGLCLIRKCGRQTLVGRIVEVEAYLGERDPASHAYRGKTNRNEVMFREGGHLYVYFTYGMHYCCNVVTEQQGIGHAVLLRALEPLSGIRMMARNRRLPLPTDVPSVLENLCSGPAKLCQALAIERKDNGTDLCGKQIWFAREIPRTSKRLVGTSTRVGINEGKHHRWRFFVRGSRFVSPGRPSDPHPGKLNGRESLPGR